ncbi:glycosyltransferase family 2 protein [Patescibacteria group bacterium]
MSAEYEKDFSLILPIYNEGIKLSKNLDNISRTLGIAGINYEIILIDDASQDDSAQRAKNFAQSNDRVVFYQHEKNMGRGRTVMDGFSKAKGQIISFIDVDCEVSPIYLLEFVNDMLNNNKVDVITGRRIYTFSISKMLRPLFSMIYRVLIRVMLGVKLLDTETGYKLFRNSSYQSIASFLKNNDWFWDTEVMTVSALAGLKIQERNVLFVRDHDKKSSVRLIPDIIKYLKAMMKFRRTIPQLKRDLKNNG